MSMGLVAALSALLRRGYTVMVTEASDTRYVVTVFKLGMATADDVTVEENTPERAIEKCLSAVLAVRPGGPP